MARRADGGIRLRPVGTRKRRQTAPTYSPAGTGCPAFEQAVENLYKGQNEEAFWTLMGALNYALEMETHVLVPLQTALTVHNMPAPWTEHPVPAEKAKGLQLWTLRNDKGRTWLPLFTSGAAACGDRSTAARPMADYTLQDAMELALSTEGIDGVVLDPWSHSATLDGALLNGLLHAGHTPEDPGDEKADAGKEAARKGNWAQAVECFEKAMLMLGEQMQNVPKEKSGSEQIRYVCKSVFAVLDMIFGDGTAKKIFGATCDMMRCMNAVDALVTARYEADAQLSEQMRALNGKSYIK